MRSETPNPKPRLGFNVIALCAYKNREAVLARRLCGGFASEYPKNGKDHNFHTLPLLFSGTRGPPKRPQDVVVYVSSQRIITCPRPIMIGLMLDISTDGGWEL